MPRSKKAKVIHLTKIKSKSNTDNKKLLFNRIKEKLNDSKFVYVVKFEVFPTSVLQKIRASIQPGTFIMAKNRLIQLCLGTSKEDSHHKNIYKLSSLVVDGAAIICSALSLTDLTQLLDDYANEPEYAITNDICTETVVLNAGEDAFSAFQFTMEPYLRKLGVPTKLNNGKISLLVDYKVCEKGDRLNANNSKLLKLLGIKQRIRTYKIRGYYDRESDQVHVL